MENLYYLINVGFFHLKKCQRELTILKKVTYCCFYSWNSSRIGNSFVENYAKIGVIVFSFVVEKLRYDFIILFSTKFTIFIHLVEKNDKFLVESFCLGTARGVCGRRGGVRQLPLHLHLQEHRGTEGATRSHSEYSSRVLKLHRFVSVRQQNGFRGNCKQILRLIPSIMEEVGPQCKVVTAGLLLEPAVKYTNKKENKIFRRKFRRNGCKVIYD
jgi:hypothetical protein